MADPKQVTEPATPAEAPTAVTEPVKAKHQRRFDPNKRVTAYDRVTGAKLPHKVPETHLDGRFPNLKETPSSKAGKS